MLFTTSWDDGNAADKKLAKLLERYGVKGTFYIPIKMKFRSLTDDDIKRLAKNFEIGSHSVTHPDMRNLSDEENFNEASKSKEILEKIIGDKINCFAYPFGVSDKRIARILSNVGYVYARNGIEFETVFPKDLMRANFSLTISNVPRIRYMMKNPFSALTKKFNWEEVAKELFADALKENTAFHLQGHSWEIENDGNWKSLESFLEYVSDFDDVKFITNHELALYCLNLNRVR